MLYHVASAHVYSTSCSAMCLLLVKESMTFSSLLTVDGKDDSSLIFFLFNLKLQPADKVSLTRFFKD